MTITNLCFQGLVTANSPGAVATPVSGSLVAFVAFSLVMMLTMMIIHIYGDIDFGADEDADGNDGDDADSGDGDSDSDECTFAEVGTENFFSPFKKPLFLQEQICTIFFFPSRNLFSFKSKFEEDDGGAPPCNQHLLYLSQVAFLLKLFFATFLTFFPWNRFVKEVQLCNRCRKTTFSFL